MSAFHPLAPLAQKVLPHIEVVEILKLLMIVTESCRKDERPKSLLALGGCASTL